MPRDSSAPIVAQNDSVKVRDSSTPIVAQNDSDCLPNCYIYVRIFLLSVYP